MKDMSRLRVDLEDERKFPSGGTTVERYPSSTVAPLVAVVFSHFGTILNRRIERLELRIDVLKVRIDVLKLQIPVLNLRIEGMKLRIDVWKLRIGGLKLRIRVSKLRIEDSKSRIGVLKIQIDDLGRRLVDINRYTSTTYTRMTGIGPVFGGA